MAWVICIREVRHVEKFVEGAGRQGTCGRLPGTSRRFRVAEDLPRARWASILGQPLTLPLDTGAGPCATLGRIFRCLLGRPAVQEPRVMTRLYGIDHEDIPAVPLAELPRCATPMAWSITHLVEPLNRHYATYVPPLRFGAKSAPRGRSPIAV